MAGKDVLAEMILILFAMAADDLGQLHHRLEFGAQLRQRNIETDAYSGGEMGVDGGGLQALMTEQFLDDAQIDTVFEQMGGKGVAQGMDAGLLGDSVVTHGISESPLQCADGQRSTVFPRKERKGFVLCRW